MQERILARAPKPARELRAGVALRALPKLRSIISFSLFRSLGPHPLISDFCSLTSDLRLRIAHHSNEQVGDAGPADFAKCGELLAIGMIEQEHAAAENWSLMHRLERPCRREMLGIHHHLEIARIEFFHAAFEHDPTAVDEHEVGEHVLDLFHLMRRHNDGAAAIEVIVQE